MTILKKKITIANLPWASLPAAQEELCQDKACGPKEIIKIPFLDLNWEGLLAAPVSVLGPDSGKELSMCLRPTEVDRT